MYRTLLVLSPLSCTFLTSLVVVFGRFHSLGLSCFRSWLAADSLALRDRVTAVDAQLGAGHVTGGVGEQECDGAHEVLGSAHLALRDEGNPLLGELGVVIEDLLGAVVALMVSMAAFPQNTSSFEYTYSAVSM